MHGGSSSVMLDCLVAAELNHEHECSILEVHVDLTPRSIKVWARQRRVYLTQSSKNRVADPVKHSAPTLLFKRAVVSMGSAPFQQLGDAIARLRNHDRMK